MALSGARGDGMELRIHESLEELSTDLADYISDLSETTIKERGAFCVAISGGSLVSLMGKLCQAPYLKTIDWAGWHVFWADERAVAKNHVDSNYKLAKDTFLSKIPFVPGHLHSINDSLTVEEAASVYEFVIRKLVKTRVIGASEITDCPKFDLIILGMGHDGHVASLFPNHPILDERSEWVTYIIDSPKPPPERITFTLPVINSSSNVALVVTGSTKADMVHLVIDDVGPECSSVPAKMIHPIDGKLLWFLDNSAASKLNGTAQFS
ncbi:putative 6-phosphogluconolactonase [Heracleum sosnowskyi]|uniref:Probable 6-phosphogluconolactonase n=1 Tax=Heracleum sosnowskyi TaxID=360622 RepID=A0AAD8HVY9_9APIA|nr:putative 6-phosphogluconolactonase [Heracleum sosnowskyi]